MNRPMICREGAAEPRLIPPLRVLRELWGDRQADRRPTVRCRWCTASAEGRRQTGCFQLPPSIHGEGAWLDHQGAGLREAQRLHLMAETLWPQLGSWFQPCRWWCHRLLLTSAWWLLSELCTVCCVTSCLRGTCIFRLLLTTALRERGFKTFIFNQSYSHFFFKCRKKITVNQWVISWRLLPTLRGLQQSRVCLSFSIDLALTGAGGTE